MAAADSGARAAHRGAQVDSPTGGRPPGVGSASAVRAAADSATGDRRADSGSARAAAAASGQAVGASDDPGGSVISAATGAETTSRDAVAPARSGRGRVAVGQDAPPTSVARATVDDGAATTPAAGAADPGHDPRHRMIGRLGGALSD